MSIMGQYWVLSAIGPHLYLYVHRGSPPQTQLLLSGTNSGSLSTETWARGRTAILSAPHTQPGAPSIRSWGPNQPPNLIGDMG
ncbi:hypothetical protein XENTR_v10003226 [Xenopus tropicalis]|nr:hypothetical protein XENTR_v10003226 [Xenopus tropicalis]